MIIGMCDFCKEIVRDGALTEIKEERYFVENGKINKSVIRKRDYCDKCIKQVVL